ncbi:MAG: Branched-chain amino acid ATP-binding cassette transporter, partial [Gaiellaceae bacterium]|nr:Branched-chain amino acid ATP-binding cassette transporter [Gaiellaceae bacterium]
VIVMAHGRVISEGTMDTVRQNKEVLDAYLVG